jgi:hypothetical protein
MAGPTSGDLRPATEPSSLDEAVRAERAERVAAMLDRWAAEDCSDEPAWDVDEIAPVRLGAADAGEP